MDFAKCNANAILRKSGFHSVFNTEISPPLHIISFCFIVITLLLPISALGGEKLRCITHPTFLSGYCVVVTKPAEELFKELCSIAGGFPSDGNTYGLYGYGTCNWHEGGTHGFRFKNYFDRIVYDEIITDDNGHSCTSDGNPINFTTGNKFQAETDFKAKGKHALRFIRYYNSQSTSQYKTTLGAQWRHNFDYSLTSYSTMSVVTYTPDGKSRLWSSKTGSVTLRQQVLDHYHNHHDGDVPLYENKAGEPKTYTSSAEPGAFLIQTTEGWELVKAVGQVEKYSSAGKITLITTQEGFTKHFFYNENNLLSEVQDHFGNRLIFTYNIDSNIESLTLSDTTVIHYQYDGNLLTAVIYPDSTPTDGSDNPRKQYLYENVQYPNALTGITDENGNRSATWGYSLFERANSSEHADGTDRYTFTYNGLDSTTGKRSTTVTNPLGKETTYYYQKINGKNRVTDVEGHPSQNCAGANKSNIYDGSGFLTSKTDWNGHITNYQRDAKGHEISRIEAVGTPEEETITTERTDYGLPIVVTKSGKATAYTYGAKNQILTQTVTDATTNESRTTTYTYNTFGLMVSRDGPRTDVQDITHYSYDNQGNLATVINALGHASTIVSYDGAGRPLELEDPNTLRSQLEYDARGRLASQTTAGASTRYQYDAVGNVTRITQPSGVYLAYGYDSANRLTGITDSLSNSINYTLDAAGNRTQEQIHDNIGALTRTRQMIYDELSRLLDNIGASGQTTHYTYDANGNPLTVTDPLNQVTQNSYDALNRLTQSMDPLGATTQYGYDALDNLTSVTDPRLLTTSYSYNAFGDLLSQTSPDTGTTTFTYDAAGNRLSQTDARGITSTYSYDALNRLIGTQYPDSSLNVSYSYDQGALGIGRLTGMQDAVGNTRYSYDERGNRITESRQSGSLTTVTHYTYDVSGNLMGMTYPSGRKVEYERDAAGQIIQVTTTYDNQTEIVADNLTYLPFGPLRQLTYGNGLQQNRSYDQDYRLTQQETAGLRSHDYEFDLSGNITRITDNQNIDIGQILGYDELNRLTQADGGYGAILYSYDSVGNRLSHIKDGALEEYTYAADSQQLLDITGVNPENRSYDAAGNSLQVNGASLTYNDANRLSQAVKGNITASYHHNGKGERGSKTINGTTIHFIYNQSGQLIAELNGSGDTQREFIYLNGQPIVLANIGGETPPGTLNLNQHPILSYGGSQDISGEANVSADGITLTVTGNGWKKIAYSYTLTENTVLEFDFQSSAQGEIHGIGFDTDASIDNTKTFRLYGTQNWGISNFATYTGTGTVHYRIPVGQFYTGNFHWLFFVNDHDVSSPTGESRFSNIQVYEDGATQPPTITAGGLYYIHNDHLGTPQIMTDDTGTVVWQGDYQPFGQVQASINTVENPLRFPGQYFDKETGLHYNYFRTYDPATGRYITSDPIGIDGGLNTYLYAYANPLKYVDPTGEAGVLLLLPYVPPLIPIIVDVATAAAAAWALCRSDDDEEERDKGCEAIRQSILADCAAMTGTARMKCLFAAEDAYNQCMNER